MHAGFPAEQQAFWVERVDALLPQTQCGKCGFPGCRPYAEAIVQARADIDQCPPGGDAGAASLAALIGVAPKPVDRACGDPDSGPLLAWVDEARCIGCTLCIQACPVDAILGAHLLMHTIVSALCTGCELCLPPCPVDCIVMKPSPIPTPPAHHNRERHQARLQRLQREAEAESLARARRKAATGNALPDHLAAVLGRIPEG